MNPDLPTTLSDGQAFVQHMLNAAEALDGYSFNYKMSALKGTKSLIEKGDFYFKKPHLMRCEFLKSVNGYPMVESDFLSWARALKKFLDQGKDAKFAAHTVSRTLKNKPSHLLEVYTDKTQTQLFKRVFVDANSYLPVEWYDYEDGKLSSESSWQNFKNDPALPATLFSLKGDN